MILLQNNAVYAVRRRALKRVGTQVLGMNYFACLPLVYLCTVIINEKINVHGS